MDPPNDPPTALIGTEAGSPRSPRGPKLQKIGEGASRRVFSDGAQALKVVPCGSPAERRRFYWEYDCMGSMGADCPNVLPVLGRHVDGASHFATLRMPLCQGSLAAYQRKLQAEAEARAQQAQQAHRMTAKAEAHPQQGIPHQISSSAFQRGLPEKQALEIAWQMGLAVAECHSRGVVHSDIQPAHFLLADFPASPAAAVAPGSVKLTGFRLAFHTEEAPEVLSEPRGTRSYMAPEMQDWDPITVMQAQEAEHHRRRVSQDAAGGAAVGSGAGGRRGGAESGGRPGGAPLVPGLASDMFSLGVTLAELLTGAWVEDAGDVTGPPWHAVSGDTRRILRQLLAAHPAQRPSATAFLRMLQQHPLLRPLLLRGPPPGAGRIERQLALPMIAEKAQEAQEGSPPAAAGARLWQPVCRTVRGFWAHASSKVGPEVSRMMAKGH